jgi:hypothetical protein
MDTAMSLRHVMAMGINGVADGATGKHRDVGAAAADVHCRRPVLFIIGEHSRRGQLFNTTSSTVRPQRCTP